ncbi:MAG: T9SS type A sorting domain-containing protein [Bacteroidia bacterium]|nr:T9SS type A sorting domain-containing protein [Bacteroidia bacterium]
MKKLALFILLFIIHNFSFSQVNNDYRTVGSGDWNAIATWQRYNGTTWVAAVVQPTSAHNNITIQSGHTVTLTVDVTADQLTVSGTLVINSGVILTVANHATTDLILSASGVITNNGTINFANATSSTTIGVINNVGTINIGITASVTTITNTGTINNSGTIFSNSTSANAFANNSPAVVVNSGTINIGGAAYCKFNSGSTYRHNFPASNIATGVVPGATWDSNSAFEMIACGNSGVIPSSISGQTFGDFIWNYSTQPVNIDFNARLGTVRDLIIRNTNGNAIYLKNTAAGAITNITRNFSIEPNTNVVLTRGDVSFGTSSHQVDVAGNFTMTGGTCIFTSSPGVGSTTNVGNATMNVIGNVLISSGTLTLCASTATSTYASGYFNVTGNFEVAGGNVNLNSSTTTGGGGLSELNVTGNFIHTSGVVSKSSDNPTVININGTTAQTIESVGFNSGDVIPFNVNQTTSTGLCSVAAAKEFVVNLGTIFVLIDNTSAANDFTINGTFTTNTDEWNLSTGITRVASAGRFKNQFLTLGSNTLTSLQILAGGIFEQNVDGGTIPTATWNATSILQVTGIVSATNLNGGGQLFGKILWNSTAQTSSIVFGTTGFGVRNDYTINSTGTGILRFPDVNFSIGTTSVATNLLVLTGSSKLQVSGGENLFATGNRIITIWGAVSVTGTAQIIAGSPNTGAAIGAVDLSKDITFLLKRNFVYTSTSPIIGFHHKSYAAFGDESYRLILNFDGTIAQNVNVLPSANNMVTLSGDGVPNSGTNDEFVSNNLYGVIAGGTTTLTLVTNTLKYNSLQINSGATLTTLTTLALVDYSLLTASGSVANPSTIVDGTLNMNLSTLTDASGTGTFTLNSLGTLITKHEQGITASGATGCIRVTGVRTYNANANYTYNGTLAQATGNGLPAVITGTLTIANTLALATGGVTLTQATAIQGASGTRQLTLTSGRLITTTTNLITIGNGSVVSPAGGSATSYVDGPIIKTGFVAASEFVFPTGDGNKWARISITPTTTTTTAAFRAEYFKSTYASLTPLDASLDHVSTQEYWDLTRTTVGTNGKVKLYWEDAAYSGILSPTATDLRVAHYYNPGSGLKWYAEGSSPIIFVSGSTGSIQSDIDVTSFSPFTFGAPNGVNPLPIELLNFKGEAVQSGNMLKWVTASETNNDYFQLERSINGVDYSPITTTNGAGNSTSIIQYSFLDQTAGKGLNYYRLKQVDFDGKYTYSNVIAIQNELIAGDDYVVKLYPNPSVDGVFYFNSSLQTTICTVLNEAGQIVYELNNLVSKSALDLSFLPAGIYLVRSTSNDGSQYVSRVVISK